MIDMLPLNITVRVDVPATTANLGAGFDALGLALAIYNTVEGRLGVGPSVLEVEGEGAELLNRAEDNLVLRAARSLFQHIGQRPPSLHLRCLNRIPVTRGLGSSAAAAVGGLLVANELAGAPLERNEILQLAVQWEGHGDNVAAALYGGLTVACQTEERTYAVAVPVKGDIQAVLVIPDRPMSTGESRAILPDTVTRADAVHNIQRTALIVAALQAGQLEMLSEAMKDRLHQPYRANLLPGFYPAIDAARQAGAYGASLSGSGSTLIALTSAELSKRVSDAMQAALQEAGVSSRSRIVPVDRDGAKVTRLPQ